MWCEFAAGGFVVCVCVCWYCVVVSRGIKCGVSLQQVALWCVCVGIVLL